MYQARIKVALFYILSALFILLNAYFLVKKHSMIINVLPLVFGIVLLAIYSFDKLLYLVVFFTPLSLPLSEIMPGLSFNMYLPTEPLLFGILLIFIMKYLAVGTFDRDIMRHPVTLAIYFSLFWILVTSFTSTMPIVSLKFFLSRIWFIVGFYLITAKLFESGKNIEKYVWFYAIPLLIVIFYATYRHLGYGLWNKQAANLLSTPLPFEFPKLAKLSLLRDSWKKLKITSSPFFPKTITWLLSKLSLIKALELKSSESAGAAITLSTAWLKTKKIKILTWSLSTPTLRHSCNHRSK